MYYPWGNVAGPGIGILRTNARLHQMYAFSALRLLIQRRPCVYKATRAMYSLASTAGWDVDVVKER
jgi:hypothetical protein